jgi:hypothetical protein
MISDGKMVSQQLAGKNFNGSGQGLIEVASWKCPRGTSQNHEKGCGRTLHSDLVIA